MRVYVHCCSYSDFLAVKFHFPCSFLSTMMLDSSDYDATEEGDADDDGGCNDDDDSLNKTTAATTTKITRKETMMAMAQTSNNIKIKTNCYFILIFLLLLCFFLCVLHICIVYS